MNLKFQAVFVLLVAVGSSNAQADGVQRLIELNQAFSQIHDDFDEVIYDARRRQTSDENVLQAQFFSRLGFITGQIQDLDFATHRRIVEHGIQIGNTAAECIMEADATLQRLSEEIGQELQEIAAIAKKDFLRISNEFVHPFLRRTEALSHTLLSMVMQSMSSTNVATELDSALQTLTVFQDLYSNMVPSFPIDLRTETEYKRRQMNYAKAEIFPMLGYSLRYYRTGTERIIAGLADCQ